MKRQTTASAMADGAALFFKKCENHETAQQRAARRPVRSSVRWWR